MYSGGDLEAVVGPNRRILVDTIDTLSELTTELRGMLNEPQLDTTELTTELRGMLDERSAHWPFKRKSTLGKTKAYSQKAAPPPKGTRSVKSTDDWVCKKRGAYTQICRGPNGRKKLIRIDKGYKKGYNQAYRQWVASKTKKATKKKS